MKVPFVCDKCGAESEHEIYPAIRACDCGNGILRIDYQDNYEQVAELTRCITCVHNTVGNGEKCNYCSNI